MQDNTEGGLLCPFPWGQHPQDLNECPACREQMERDAEEDRLRYPDPDDDEEDPDSSDAYWDSRDTWSEVQQDRVDLYLNEF